MIPTILESQKRSGRKKYYVINRELGSNVHIKYTFLYSSSCSFTPDVEKLKNAEKAVNFIGIGIRQEIDEKK
jgi:predicted transcriptional regulator